MCQRNLQLQINGLITFSYPTGDYTPYPFTTGRNRVAVYFADVDYVCSPSYQIGNLFYRVSRGKHTKTKLIALKDVER